MYLYKYVSDIYSHLPLKVDFLFFKDSYFRNTLFLFLRAENLGKLSLSFKESAHEVWSHDVRTKAVNDIQTFRESFL